MWKLYEPRKNILLSKQKQMQNGGRAPPSEDSAMHMAFAIWHTILKHCKSSQVESLL